MNRISGIVLAIIIALPSMAQKKNASTMVVLTGINILGVQYSQYLSNILTTIKLSAIALLIFAGIFYGQSDAIYQNFEMAYTTPSNLIVVLFSGMIGVFFSDGGWHHSTYVAGEVINPTRNVARAMILGMTIISVGIFGSCRIIPVPWCYHWTCQP